MFTCSIIISTCKMMMLTWYSNYAACQHITLHVDIHKSHVKINSGILRPRVIDDDKDDKPTSFSFSGL